MSALSSTVSTRSGPFDAEGTSSGKTAARVLIPARNEAATIGRVVRGCRRAGFAVTVIDDASRDETAALAREAGAEVLTVPGPPTAKPSRCTTPSRSCPSTDRMDLLPRRRRPASARRPRPFWEKRRGADMIVGDRLAEAQRMPLLRRATNRFMSALLRRSGIRDSQCGFRLVRRAWLGRWLPTGHHFQFETELALLAAAHPTRIVNLPIAAIYGRERSKISPWRDALNFAKCLLSCSGGL